MGGTCGWHRHLAREGVPGLESVGQGKGVRQCAVAGVGSVLREGGYGVL